MYAREGFIPVWIAVNVAYHQPDTLGRKVPCCASFQSYILQLDSLQNSFGVRNKYSFDSTAFAPLIMFTCSVNHILVEQGVDKLNK